MLEATGAFFPFKFGPGSSIPIYFSGANLVSLIYLHIPRLTEDSTCGFKLDSAIYGPVVFQCGSKGIVVSDLAHLLPLNLVSERSKLPMLLESSK
jgi:hypothetical protein